MSVNRKYVWAAGGLLVVSLLVFWRGEPDPIPVEEKPALIVSDKSTHERERSESGRHAHQEECASCPDLPVLETEKRSAPMDRRARNRECWALLQEAAVAGDPEPDLSHLGGCDGETPLHYAETGEQVRILLENGADPNSQDIYGHTPMHLQAVSLVGGGIGADVIQELLEAGADPWITDARGELPIDHAQKMSTASALTGFKGKVLATTLDVAMKVRGISRAEAERDHPEFKRMMERLENPSKVAQEAVTLLTRGMVQTRPPGIEIPEHLKEFF